MKTMKVLLFHDQEEKRIKKMLRTTLNCIGIIAIIGSIPQFLYISYVAPFVAIPILVV